MAFSLRVALLRRVTLTAIVPCIEVVQHRLGEPWLVGYCKRLTERLMMVNDG